MQFRDHPAVAGKRDFYPIDPRKLKVDEKYNVRDMNSADTKAHIAALKASIIANGVRVPLEVRLDGDDIFIVAGHCRHIAVLEALAEGHDLKTVPCIPEAKGTNDEERTLNLVVSNSGKPLDPLAIAKVIKRLTDYGWDDAEIAKRIGWKSKSSVKRHLEMLAMPAAVQTMVRKGEVSATTAVATVRRDGEKAAETLRAAKVTADKAGRKKVTQRSIGQRNGAVPAPTPSNANRINVPELVAALEPFARLLEEWDALLTDHQAIAVPFDDVRRAAAAYAELDRVVDAFARSNGAADTPHTLPANQQPAP